VNSSASEEITADIGVENCYLIGVHSDTVVLAFVVVATLGFDFTNGFHDSANAMATSIATGALSPRIAVGISAIANFLGAFLSLSVAATIAKGIVDQSSVTLAVVFAGLAGGIAWNVLTWYLGMPSSSSHALIGGVVGATLVEAGSHAVIWTGLVSKVMTPAVAAPIVATIVAASGTYLVYRIARGASAHVSVPGFRIGQICTATLVSLAHGTNDAQKSMGILTLALVANGSISADARTPTWVIVSCATAISLGTYTGGWRIIRTLGKGLIEIDTPQGFAAEASSAAVILTSTHLGFPLSTTQVCSGSVVGAGVGLGQKVRWNVFGRMVVTWLVTLPAAAAVGAAAMALTKATGQTTGVILVAALLVSFCLAIYLLSRRDAVDPGNVNDAWDDTDTTELKVAA
jgi:inorganic phosphate transporter, PiT family